MLQIPLPDRISLDLRKKFSLKSMGRFMSTSRLIIVSPHKYHQHFLQRQMNREKWKKFSLLTPFNPLSSLYCCSTSTEKQVDFSENNWSAEGKLTVKLWGSKSVRHVKYAFKLISDFSIWIKNCFDLLTALTFTMKSYELTPQQQLGTFNHGRRSAVKITYLPIKLVCYENNLRK